VLHQAERRVYKDENKKKQDLGTYITSMHFE